MEYDEAFWRLVDVVNLERHVEQAEIGVAAAQAAIDAAYQHVEAAEASKAEARGQLEEVQARLQTAYDRVSEIPPDLAAAAAIDVDTRNATRDAVVKAMAQAASGKGVAGRATAAVRAGAKPAAAEGIAERSEGN